LIEFDESTFTTKLIFILCEHNDLHNILLKNDLIIEQLIVSLFLNKLI